MAGGNWCSVHLDENCSKGGVLFRQGLRVDFLVFLSAMVLVSQQKKLEEFSSATIDSWTQLRSNGASQCGKQTGAVGTDFALRGKRPT